MTNMCRHSLSIITHLFINREVLRQCNPIVWFSSDGWGSAKILEREEIVCHVIAPHDHERARTKMACYVVTQGEDNAVF